MPSPCIGTHVVDGLRSFPSQLSLGLARRGPKGRQIPRAPWRHFDGNLLATGLLHGVDQLEDRCRLASTEVVDLVRRYVWIE